MKLDLQRERASFETGMSEPLHQFCHHMIQLYHHCRAAADVLFQRMFTSHRLPYAHALDRTKVYAARKIIIHGALFAKHFSKMSQRALPQLHARKYPHAVHLPCRLGTHAPEILYPHACNKVHRLVGMYHKHTVGLANLRRHLGKKLVIRHACRCRKRQSVPYFTPYLPCNISGKLRTGLVLGNVEKRLVERQRLYNIGILSEYIMHTPRHFLIMLIMRRHDDKLRTQPLCLCHGHCRPHAVAPRLVTGSGNHTSWTVKAHGYRFAAQRHVVALLHRCEESIHVYVYDLAVHHINSELINHHRQNKKSDLITYNPYYYKPAI